MADEIEALGGLATGAAVAHAVDHERGVRGEAHGRCLNCDTALDGRFCHACGQPAHVHRTIGHVFEEFLHGVLHLDTKAWRTLPLLLFKPGKLTREYVHGKRARYIAPFATFLFTVFLMFFVFGFIGAPDMGREVFMPDSKAEEVADARRDLAKAEAELRAASAALAAVRADPNADPGAEGSASGEVAAATAAVEVAKAALEREEEAPDDKPSVRKSDGSWQDNLRVAVESGNLEVNIGTPELDAKARKALLNPDLTLYKIQQKAYKLSFLLVPMSLPFLWLLFPFRRSVTLYDHTVFALYSLSFMSLLFVTAMLLLEFGGVVGEQIAGLLLFVPPVHMYAQLKGAYSLGWGGALWRTLWLLLFSTIVMSLYVGLIFFLGLVD
jgi:Tfp pilus assembly protein PilX